MGCVTVVSTVAWCSASSAAPVPVGALLRTTLPLPLPPTLPPLCGVAVPFAFESSLLLAAALRACSSAVRAYDALGTREFLVRASS